MTDATTEVLGRLVSALQNLKVTTRDINSSDLRIPFSAATTITGTTTLDIWTPTPGRRFLLRGGIVSAVVHTILAAANAGTLDLVDSASSKVVSPVGVFAATAAIGTAIASAVQLNLGDGVLGSVVDAKVRLKQSLDISSGKITVSGILWGSEVA